MRSWVGLDRIVVVDKVRLRSVMVIPYNQRHTADYAGWGHDAEPWSFRYWWHGHRVERRGRRGELCGHDGRKSPRDGKMNILKKLFSAQIRLWIIEPNKTFSKRLWLFKCIISVRGGHCDYSPRAAGVQCREIRTHKWSAHIIFVFLKRIFEVIGLHCISAYSLCRLEA